MKISGDVSCSARRLLVLLWTVLAVVLIGEVPAGATIVGDRVSPTSSPITSYSYDAASDTPMTTLGFGGRAEAGRALDGAQFDVAVGELLAAPAGFVAADTAADDDLAGVVKGWRQRPADNGKGTVWQEPGATGNANSIRIMDPNAQYPNGYVRFYNEHGQPIGLDGKPGPNSVTHIPRSPDGSYPLPKGWGQ